jgi:hypothetical protein
VGPGGHPRPPAGPRAAPWLRVGRASAPLLWALNRGRPPPSAYLDPAAPCASPFLWNPSPRPAPPPPNPRHRRRYRSPPAPSLLRCGLVQELRVEVRRPAVPLVDVPLPRPAGKSSSGLALRRRPPLCVVRRRRRLSFKVDAMVEFAASSSASRT